MLQLHNILKTTEADYLSLDLQFLIISFNLYEPSLDMFVTVRMTIESLLAGLLRPKQIQILVFAFDQTQVSDDGVLIDIL